MHLLKEVYDNSSPDFKVIIITITTTDRRIPIVPVITVIFITTLHRIAKYRP